MQLVPRDPCLEHRESLGPCPIAPGECANRAACERDERRLSRAREGSRADFDAYFDQSFARLYRVARSRFPSRELAEATTRALLIGALAASDASSRCVTARLLRELQHLGSSGRGV